MRRHLQILTVLAALTVPAGVAGAQTLAQAKIDAVNKAAESFTAMAKDSHTTGAPPRYSDPAAKPLLDAVWDTKDIQGAKPLPWTAVALLEQWNKAATKVGSIYYVAGTGTSDILEVAKDQKKIIKANSNTRAFAPELGRYYDAQIRLHAAMIDAAMAKLVAATDDEKKDVEFRKTLNFISDSSTGSIMGVFGAIIMDGVQEDWILSRVVVLLEIAPKAAKYMSPSDRDRIKNAAVEVAGLMKNPDARSGVNFVARAFAQL